MEGGQVSHRWCMCVISHGYGGFGAYMDGDVGWYACRTKPCELVACQEMLEHFLSAR